MSTISRLLARAVAAGARFIPDKAPDPLRDAHTYLGKPLNRVDGRPKVTGQARLSAEFRPRTLAYAAVVTSTIAKGRIRHIDTAAAYLSAVLRRPSSTQFPPTTLSRPSRPPPPPCWPAT